MKILNIILFTYFILLCGCKNDSHPVAAYSSCENGCFAGYVLILYSDNSATWENWTDTFDGCENEVSWNKNQNSLRIYLPRH